MDTPRVAPLAPEEMDDETRARFGDGPILAIFRTLAHHPALMKRWLVFGNHVLAKSSLPARQRELVILRVGWLCQAGYEWGQHVLIGRAAGLSDAEIARIAKGPEADGWTPEEQWLLRAADELHADAFITDATWEALAGIFEVEQLIDLIFTVGQYNLVSMALNSLGVQPEEGLPRLPER
ncbi:MAG: carboxymuconolactone decarboxylase family protein [Myxococcota bacterium]|nr:carboxymuconolactone decarboxylase family protein [Myxococcota bacterium]